MTFETWWVQCVVWEGLDTNLTRTKAKFVWDAAVKAERERCLDIVAMHFRDQGREFVHDLLRHELLGEIQRGVQDQTTATRRQGTEGTSGETTEGSSSG